MCLCNIYKKIALPGEFILGDLATVIQTTENAI